MVDPTTTTPTSLSAENVVDPEDPEVPEVGSCAREVASIGAVDQEAGVAETAISPTAAATTEASGNEVGQTTGTTTTTTTNNNETITVPQWYHCSRRRTIHYTVQAIVLLVALGVWTYYIGLSLFQLAFFIPLLLLIWFSINRPEEGL